MEQKKIVVISDTHLGSETCDRAALNDFLDGLKKDPLASDLVLLGDIVDMWRRDASGVFLENRDTIDRILDLPKSIQVHYVAGNHDYHVHRYRNSKPYFRYPLEFSRELSIVDGQFTYRFIHGYELEYGQEHEEPVMYMVMDALCRVMSDGEGSLEDEVWGISTKTWSEVAYFFSMITRRKKYRIKMATRRLQNAPETRLADNMREIEKKAYDRLMGRPDEILVFGHTHHPFINEEENVVNVGSWVTDAAVHDTYVELSGGKPRLFVFGGNEITERARLR
jgi:UDP-2,3-diacylglucosamine pyrophosphatase LpxH